MRRLLVLIGALAGSLLGATPAHAWDELGHRVIARIAWDNLTPAAREKAVQLLMSAPEGAGLRALLPQGPEPLPTRQRELFVMASVWPDIIRDREHPGHVYAHSDWHYVNHFWEQRTPGGPAVDRPDLALLGELLNQLPRLAAAVGNASVPDSTRAVDLAWVLHLVGDAHQPLHNSARITPSEPEGDRGGNLFRLEDGYNLHALWDGLIGPAFPWRPGDDSEAEYVGRIASTIEARHPPAELRRRLAAGDFAEWSREGAEIAERYAYPASLHRGEPAPLAYRRRMYRIAEPMVALAGYRLAELLNRELGG